MFDKDLVVDILKNIDWALGQIENRFKPVKTSDYFIRNEVGIEKLDSICMQLINIGEALKQVDKLTNSELLTKYPDIDWKKAKGMRDIITHHYFDIDAETVFVVCEEHVGEMKIVINKVLNDLQDPRIINKKH